MMDVKIFNNDEVNDFFQKQLPLQLNKVIKFESSSSQNNISDFKLKNEVLLFLSQHLNHQLIIGPIQNICGTHYAELYYSDSYSNQHITKIGQLMFFQFYSESFDIRVTDILSRHELNYQVYFPKYQKHLKDKDDKINKALEQYKQLSAAGEAR